MRSPGEICNAFNFWIAGYFFCFGSLVRIQIFNQSSPCSAGCDSIPCDSLCFRQQDCGSADCAGNRAGAGLDPAADTQAPTNLNYIEISDLSPSFNGTTQTYLAMSGQTFHVIGVAYTQSVLGAPTGTVSILQNGNAPSGTVTSYPLNGSYSGGFTGVGFAYLEGDLATSIDTPGSYNFTATYLGDANYLGSQTPFPVNVTVQDTTYKISGTIADVTVKAGQTSATTVNFAGVDNFGGQITVTCKLPAAMTEATCSGASAALTNVATVSSTITIPTTAAHQLAANEKPRVGGIALALAGGVFLFAFGGKRRGSLAALVLLIWAGTFVGCGGGGSSSTSGGGSTDPGTPTGAYIVNVTTTSQNITRTATFTVTVQ